MSSLNYTLRNISYLFLISITSCNDYIEDMYGAWHIQDISYKVYEDTIPYYGRSVSFLRNGTAYFLSHDKAYESGQWQILFKNSTKGYLSLQCNTDTVYNDYLKFKLEKVNGRTFIKLVSDKIELTAEKLKIGINSPIPVEFFERININKKK